MRIKTCIKPDPYIQAATCFVERKELAFTILGHMAIIYELAMTVHIPNSHLLPAAELLPLTAPVHTKFQSSVLFREFYEAFYPLL